MMTFDQTIAFSGLMLCGIMEKVSFLQLIFMIRLKKIIKQTGDEQCSLFGVIRLVYAIMIFAENRTQHPNWKIEG